MYKLLSGAKTVKQYRRDENLPEAKKGMKDCGCKHPKTRYKYGTGALMIPEGSAIVTANGGKNKQAIAAYKKGNYKLLNKIIEDMPEDNVDKAQGGKKVTKVKGRYTTIDPATKETYQEESVLGDVRYGSELPQNQAEILYKLPESELRRRYKPFTVAQELARRNAVKNKQETFTFTHGGKTYRGYKDAGYASGYKVPKTTTTVTDISNQRAATETTTPTPIPQNKEKETPTSNKRKGSFLQNIPSLAEVAARASILGQGIEGVPENYLRLGRYNYASQLPATLREIQLSEQAGRETARDILSGDAGRYLAQAGNLSAARMKAANEAVIQDTLARQDILNKNVDLGNVESQTNRQLKDLYASARAQARSNYNDQLVALGQRIDSATETGREMANQREMDERRLNLLKTGNYKMDPQGNVIFAGKNGAKKLKTYKRK
jgi:hypothetical protein